MSYARSGPVQRRRRRRWAALAYKAPRCAPGQVGSPLTICCPPSMPPLHWGPPLNQWMCTPQPAIPGTPIYPGSMRGMGGTDGLGKVFTTTLLTPFGNRNFSMNVPYEGLAKNAVNFTVGELEKQMPRLLDKALKQAGGYVTGTLWPSLQPKLRVEVDRALAKAKVEGDQLVDEATKRGAIIASALMVTMIGGAWWIRRGQRKG